MNIIEAIKSGRKFRRKDRLSWRDENETLILVHEDILTDDWELEPEPEEKKELSWREIKQALMQVNTYSLKSFKERLGFKD